jgi:hypothetical protein
MNFGNSPKRIFDAAGGGLLQMEGLRKLTAKAGNGVGVVAYGTLTRPACIEHAASISFWIRSPRNSSTVQLGSEAWLRRQDVLVHAKQIAGIGSSSDSGY